jgi:flagellar biosynthesis protein FlhG
MNVDQATGLRGLVKDSRQNLEAFGKARGKDTQRIRVISVTSGKGGVGKTNVVANLALAFQNMGIRVLILDADLGLGNMDILLGLNPKYTINHFLSGEKRLEDIIISTPGGFKLLPAASGIQELTDLDSSQRLVLLNELDTLHNEFDVILIDTGAGVSSNVMYFNFAAMERIVIITSEPTSLTDAYALIKILSTKYQQKKFKVLVNSAGSEKEAGQIYRNLSMVADRYLASPSLDYLGWIPYDEKIVKAVKRQKAVLASYPKCPASRSFDALAKKLISIENDTVFEGDIKFFWRTLLNN